MSEPKFTAEPWGVNHLIHVHSLKDGNQVCKMTGFERRKRSQMQANAHLIAAAPEMYEELEKVLRLLKSKPFLDEKSEGIARIENLLAKARGKHD